MTEALSEFAENTMRYLRDEGSLLAEGIDFPPLATRFRDRHALVVARGPGPQARPADRPAVHPRLQAGADRRRRRRGRADRGRLQAGRDRRRHGLGVGRGAAERRRAARPRLPRNGTRPGASAAERLGVPYEVVPATGISEDVALLLAYEKGAELIVAVGTHFNLIEFLERNRAGMSSTFLTRLKVGEILVDAKGVSRLVSRRVGVWPLVALRRWPASARSPSPSPPRPALRHLIEFLVLRLRDLLGIG